MTRFRITKDQLDGYTSFLDELEYILATLHTLNPRRDTELDELRLFMVHIERIQTLNQIKHDSSRWQYLPYYTKIAQSNLLGTIRSTKFVQYKDFSLRNFILQHIQLEEFPVKSQTIELPDHVELKRFWVPEELILKERQDTIYEADWLK